MIWPKARLWLFLVSSLLVAAGSLSQSLSPDDWGGWGSMLLTVLWALLLCIALVRYRWQGLWLLIGAPLALYGPWMEWMTMLTCHRNPKLCP
jgi:hypothetical protein